jgi:hypothetical protein
MKDDLGLYYYPCLDNKRVRMYVREGSDNIWFRLWNADDPKLWEEHGWVPYDAVKQAQSIYTAKGFDPQRAYDLEVAKELIREEKQS